MANNPTIWHLWLPRHFETKPLAQQLQFSFQMSFNSTLLLTIEENGDGFDVIFLSLKLS